MSHDKKDGSTYLIMNIMGNRIALLHKTPQNNITSLGLTVIIWGVKLVPTELANNLPEKGNKELSLNNHLLWSITVSFKECNQHVRKLNQHLHLYLMLMQVPPIHFILNIPNNKVHYSWYSFTSISIKTRTWSQRKRISWLPVFSNVLLPALLMELDVGFGGITEFKDLSGLYFMRPPVLLFTNYHRLQRQNAFLRHWISHESTGKSWDSSSWSCMVICWSIWTLHVHKD